MTLLPKNPISPQGAITVKDTHSHQPHTTPPRVMPQVSQGHLMELQTFHLAQGYHCIHSIIMELQDDMATTPHQIPQVVIILVTTDNSLTQVTATITRTVQLIIVVPGIALMVLALKVLVIVPLGMVRA